jgi:hypothetical protein
MPLLLLQDTLTQLYADMIPNLTSMARSMVRDLDPLVRHQPDLDAWQLVVSSTALPVVLSGLDC